MHKRIGSFWASRKIVVFMYYFGKGHRYLKHHRVGLEFGAILWLSFSINTVFPIKVYWAALV